MAKKLIDPTILRDYGKATAQDEGWADRVEGLCQAMVFSGQVTARDIRTFRELCIRVPDDVTTPAEAIACAEDFMRPMLGFRGFREQQQEAWGNLLEALAGLLLPKWLRNGKN